MLKESAYEQRKRLEIERSLYDLKQQKHNLYVQKLHLQFPFQMKNVSDILGGVWVYLDYIVQVLHIDGKMLFYTLHLFLKFVSYQTSSNFSPIILISNIYIVSTRMLIINQVYYKWNVVLNTNIVKNSYGNDYSTRTKAYIQINRTSLLLVWQNRLSICQ